MRRNILTLLPALLLSLCAALLGPGQSMAEGKAQTLRQDPERRQIKSNFAIQSIIASPGQATTSATEPSLLPGAPAAPAARCTGDLAGAPFWIIINWVIGQELYKSYQDPALVCPGAYPFTVDTVHVLLQIEPDDSLLPLAIPLTVDIEEVDALTSPGCALPGAPIFQGSPGVVNIETGGLFDISIPLDVPVIVNGPYFVGLKFDSVVTQNMRIQLVTDGFEALCVSYNKWDDSIGFIDLLDDSVVYTHAFPPNDPCFSAPPNDTLCFNFNGRLKLWTNGTTGGVSLPEPGVAFLNPLQDDVLFESVDIWINETSGLGIVDSAVFSYRPESGAWVRIGVDNNQLITAPSAGAPGPGRGLSYFWDFSALAEQSVWIKAQVYDTLRRSAVDSVLVLLEPTPPVPRLTSHQYFGSACGAQTLNYTWTDNPVFFGFGFKKLADIEHRKNLGTFDQFLLGDNNGFPADGNSAANGEFGDFFGGPAIGALALEYWFNEGFVSSMRVGGSKLTIAQAAERLGDFMEIRVNGGLEDDMFVRGFRDYLVATGFAELRLDITRDGDYETLRNWAEEIGGVVMFAVDGVPGRWLAVDGFSGLPTAENAFRIVVSDPFDASVRIMFWRDTPTGSEVFINGAWHTVALVTALLPSTWSPTGRTEFAQAFSPSSPFDLPVDPNTLGLVDGELYFFTFELSDVEGNSGSQTVMLEYVCNAFTAGDYNGDRRTNIADFVYVINFQLFNGPAPVGGAGRADANCSGGIDTADLVHYSNWLFLGGPAPCQ
ncbi:MAG: hypothetical protein ACE5GA_00945 [Candidatus Zixiibacteriota bacterium]